MTSTASAAVQIAINSTSACPAVDKMGMAPEQACDASATSSNTATDKDTEMSSSTGTTEELDSARVDAKETLLALLQFSEGVRVITKHMQNATTTSDDDDITEESKSADNDTDKANPSLHIERMVADTCLQGTVFGTDLLRLWDAADHVRDYARLVTEESTVTANDVVDAQKTAQQALQRAKKAESLALNLHRRNQDLKRQLDQLSSQKKCLVQEVKTLRQQAATSRKMDMERLLQQHVAGAILLHEEQLKAMAATAQQQHKQQQKQKQQRKIREEAEEEKKEDYDDMEVVTVEDCEEAGMLGDDTASLSSTGNEARKETAVSTPIRDDNDKEPVGTEEVAGAANQETKPTDKPEANPCDATAQSLEGVTADPQSAPSTPTSSYSPIKLLPSVGRLTPPPPPIAPTTDKPSSSRSVASNDSTQSANSTIEPFPEQPKEHVGSKVFNFLFHPEKIGQQKAQELRHKQQRVQQNEHEGIRHPHQNLSIRPTALLALDDPKEDASVDATAPTLAATTPGSTVASSWRARARSMSGDRLAIPADTTAEDSDAQDPRQKLQPRPTNTISTIIPNSVSFSNDTLSVQSNLPSPKFQTRTLTIAGGGGGGGGGGGDQDSSPPQDVELYKDFKMFLSLAIPADDEIDEYHQSRDHDELWV